MSQVIPVHIQPNYDNMSHQELIVVCEKRKILTQGCRYKEDLVARIIKYDAQPVVYDAWSLKELKKAAESRALRIPESKPLRSPNLVAARKAALVAVLEAADRDFQFRFFDMAPELRNRVYHLVVAPDTTKALTHPTVPAICRASRVLRSESLPVFFGMNRFWLKIRGSSYERRAQHRVKVLRKARLEQASLRWLQHVVGENVGLLCRLLISVKSFKQAHHHRLSLTSLDLDPAVLGGFDYDTPGVWLDTNGRFWNVDGEESVAPPGLGNLLRGIVEAGDGMTKEALRKIVQCYTKAF